jgi:putative peptidoglycan lipid II flippase
MAYAFGIEPSIAAFMVAFRFAHLLRRLFGEGALQSAFIPTFEGLRHQSHERAIAFFKSLSVVLTLFLTLLVILGSTAIACILKFSAISSSDQEILFLALIMLPSLLFICLFGINASLLQCERQYFIPGIAPAAFNIIWIGFVFYLKDMPAKEAMPWLSMGVVVACFSQWLITVNRTIKFIHTSTKVPLWTTFCSALPDIGRLGKPLFLGILGVSASQINNAIDVLFARYAEPEGPALLWYAIRIEQLPLALFGIAIAGAILPPLSRALKAQRWEQYHYFLHDALTQTCMFMIPVTCAIFVLGDLSVHLLYGRGDFSSEASINTTYCLWAYSLGLVPSALLLVLGPACYAQNNYHLPAIASFLSLTSNLLLNSLFIVFFEWGSVSVALATSISSWINLILIGKRLSSCGLSLVSWPLFSKGFAASFGAICACWGTYGLRLHLLKLPFFSPYLFSATTLEQMAFLGLQTMTFTAIFSSSFYSLNSILNTTKERLFKTMNTLD